MEWIYIISSTILILFLVINYRSDNKLSVIEELIQSVIIFLAYNITICMIFGSMNITTNLNFLTVFNLIISCIFILKIVRKKKIQKLNLKLVDLFFVLISIGIVIFVAKSQYKPLANIMAFKSNDAGVHFCASTFFSENMKILNKVENNTGYNFKTMQTASYISTGIVMNVLKNTLNIEEYISYKVFEIFIFFLEIIGFYLLIKNKIKKKTDWIIASVFIILYSFGYIYASLLYGFSYLSMGILFFIGIIYSLKKYEEENSMYYIASILLFSIGLIYSYCLFVPCVYAIICIIILKTDLKNNLKTKYFKYFSFNTILVTVILSIITILSIFYLVIPTFTDPEQNKLTDAINFAGDSYCDLYSNWIFYFPFIFVFLYNSIKKKDINLENTSLALILLQTIVMLIGLFLYKVSFYYYFKMYYILWVIVLQIAFEVIASIDIKEFKVWINTYIVLWCVIICMSLTDFDNKIMNNYPNLIQVPRASYISGIYYDLNKNVIPYINSTARVNEYKIEIAKVVRDLEKEEISENNLILSNMNGFDLTWLYNIGKLYNYGIKTTLYAYDSDTAIKEFIENSSKKYLIIFDNIDKYDIKNCDIVFKNNGGSIIKKH